MNLPENFRNEFISAEEITKAACKFFKAKPLTKERLIFIADEFVNGNVFVYQQKVKLNTYTVFKFSDNRKKNEIFNKDIRFHWEIYRAKFLFNVGLAYNLTGNPKYSVALINYLKQWKDFSPIAHKKVEYNGMEASLKIINLSWINTFLSKSREYNPAVKKELISAITLHAEYVYNHYDITIYGLESNHGLSCGVGLVFAASMFPNDKNAQKWLRFGIKILKRGLKTQFSADGVNFESSVQYHRYTTELLLIALSVLIRSCVNYPEEITIYIIKTLSALESLKHTNQYISRFGDSDGGKVFYDLYSLEEFSNLEYLSWFKPSNGQVFYETLIFEGCNEIKNILKTERLSGRIGSYAVYKKNDLSLIFSANSIGTKGKGNHQHNDFLSFELSGIKPFIVDGWSYCYTGNPELRNLDRKTSSHNAVEIDEREIVPFIPHNLFELLGSIKVKIDFLEENDNFWRVAASHNGYRNLPSGGQFHTRKIEVNKASDSIKIIDNLEGIGNHKASLRLLVPEKYWKMECKGKRIEFFNESEKFIMDLMNENYRVNIRTISEQFLSLERAYEVALAVEYSDNAEIMTVISYKRFYY